VATNAGRGATLSRDPLAKVENWPRWPIEMETAAERGDNHKQSGVGLSS